MCIHWDDDDSNKPSLISVVEFAHRSDMEYALKKLDDSELNGQRVRLFEVLWWWL